MKKAWKINAEKQGTPCVHLTSRASVCHWISTQDQLLMLLLCINIFIHFVRKLPIYAVIDRFC